MSFYASLTAAAGAIFLTRYFCDLSRVIGASLIAIAIYMAVGPA
jgi:conjugal transfer pilus assembly protein TraK